MLSRPLSSRVWGQAPPLLYTGLAGRSVKSVSMGERSCPPGRPKGPHTAPSRPRPYALRAQCRGARSSALLVGEQAEEDFVTEQASSFAES